MNISEKTAAVLEDIERRIDPETEEDFVKQWEDFLYDRFEMDIFTPVRKKINPPATDMEDININDAVEDYDLMLRSELIKVSKSLASKSNSLAVRANYGTGILSSLFGAEIFVMPREQNTLPTTKPFNDTAKIEKMIEKGIPDLNNGFGKKVFEFGELCAETFAKYPKISKYLKVYHPDLQGPLDICELLWGGEMFYAMYDEPELVHSMLSLVTETYTAFLNKWYELFPCDSYMNPHWNTIWHRGKIFLRCDSAMNLSPELYKEFANPYDAVLLERFDGGAMHFCGRGDHYIETLCDTPKLYGINLGQPLHNDMEKIFANSVDKEIKILGFSKKILETLGKREKGYNRSLHVR
ncbi:MAG: hypothetical protein IJW79_05400 [Clostridia bacterium]|nr:hypothetical protein [Clostridia bacterium]